VCGCGDASWPWRACTFYQQDDHVLVMK